MKLDRQERGYDHDEAHNSPSLQHSGMAGRSSASQASQRQRLGCCLIRHRWRERRYEVEGVRGYVVDGDIALGGRRCGERPS
jgi:hypothetical protein